MVASSDGSPAGVLGAQPATAATMRPWWVELGSVLPRSMTFAARATRPDPTTAVPGLSFNPLSWATVAIDDIAISGVYLLTRKRADQLTRERLGAAERAVELLQDSGATANPASLYDAPATPFALRISQRHRNGLDFEQVSFDSTLPSLPGLMELTEWQVDANARVHAYLLRHHDGPRPWAVVIHGHGMGEARDIRFLGSKKLYTDLGVNVAHLVLPMHGPRGRVDAHTFPGADPVANLLGVVQSVSDARALIAWIRTQTDAPVGVFGISLGGLVASMLGGLEPDLACVIAGIPLTNMASMLSDTVRSRWGEEALAEAHFNDPAPVELSRLASPLSFPPVVPHDRRFIYAAVGDRLVTARQAANLGAHWDNPRTLWLQGAHILNNIRSSRRFVTRAFAASGVSSR